jgi:hypothetical protein
MNTFETVFDALEGLKKMGYTLDLNINFDKNLSKEEWLNPIEFEIIETYRFEGDSNPSDEDVVYALCSKDGKHKGIFTGAFGCYANMESFENIHYLANHH